MLMVTLMSSWYVLGKALNEGRIQDFVRGGGSSNILSDKAISALACMCRIIFFVKFGVPQKGGGGGVLTLIPRTPLDPCTTVFQLQLRR